MAMGKSLVQWFVYLLAIGVCCAYIAGANWHSARPTWRVSHHRLCRLHGYADGAAAGLHCTAQLAMTVSHDRRPGVRAADRRHVRVALAALGPHRARGG